MLNQTWIRDFLRSRGLEFRRIREDKDPEYRLVSQMKDMGVGLVLDIGANEGQFAQEIMSFGYKGRIVSFEPLTSAHEVLSDAAGSYANWLAHPRCAIGDDDSQIEINISDNSVSSSVLPMLEAHRQAAEESAYVGSEPVPCHRLDSVALQYIEEGEKYLVKIDTQGYEWQVLQGGPKTVGCASAVLCELSFTPLYEGQKLWRDVVDHIEGMGFTLWSFHPMFTDHATGRTLQVDALFLRT